jgi:hypothetical protein
LDGDGIGRANLDGTGKVGLITLPGSSMCGITVDDNYVYWTDAATLGAVDRAKRDGTGTDTRFIVPSPTGASATGFAALPPTAPVCVAVDGAHVYWTTTLSIGRAKLDGTGVQESFIPLPTARINPDAAPVPCLAVDRTHIYWADGATGTIGRANLDGTGVNQDFISLGSGGSGLTCVVVDGAHIYWGIGVSPRALLAGPPFPGGAIGRANLDGTDVNDSFISRPGVPSPVPCADDGVYLYYASGATPAASNSVGRARLDGTDVQPDFLTSGAGPQTGPGCAIGR